MALIAMCVYGTLENNRYGYIMSTIDTLLNTVDFNKHRLGIFNNNSDDPRVKEYLSDLREDYWLSTPDNLIIIHSPENMGTAYGINQIWKMRKPGEGCVKMDDDVIIHYDGWLDEMEQVCVRAPQFAPLALKRNDLEESVYNENPWYKSELYQLPHQKGERWFIVEKVQHAFGTVQYYNSEFLDKYGFMCQPGKYGLDDSLASARAIALGYQPAFLPHIHITHLDNGGTSYNVWKENMAAEGMAQYGKWLEGLQTGELNPYYSGEGEWK